jgi:hypothetical protein
MNQQVLQFKEVYLKTLSREVAERKVAFREKLNPEWFDFSLESLYYVDCYLFSIFASKDELDEQVVENSIWALGFYVGEVIRRNSPKGYQWKNWDEFFPSQKETVQETYASTMGTSAVLVDASGNFILPINKVVRFIQDGPEYSLHFFARNEIELKKIVPQANPVQDEKNLA